jgi:hypothetical protein
MTLAGLLVLHAIIASGTNVEEPVREPWVLLAVVLVDVECGHLVSNLARSK